MSASRTLSTLLVLCLCVASCRSDPAPCTASPSFTADYEPVPIGKPTVVALSDASPVTTMVTSNAGTVYVYTRGDTNNTERFDLSQDFAAQNLDNATFGQSLALSGNVLAVGHPGWVNAQNVSNGAVLIFRRASSSANYSLEQTITAPTPSAGAQFGASVAVSGNVLLVGAPGSGSTGQATLFVYSGGQWAPANSQPVLAQIAVQRLGAAVAIVPAAPNGYGYLLLGAPAGGSPGVYALPLNVTSGQIFNPVPTRLPGSPAGATQCGAAISTVGPSAAWGCPGFNASAGAVFVSQLVNGTAGQQSWNTTKQLTSPAPTAGAMFGQSLAYVGEALAVAEVLAGKSAAIVRLYLRDLHVHAQNFQFQLPPSGTSVSLALRGGVLALGEYGQLETHECHIF